MVWTHSARVRNTAIIALAAAASIAAAMAAYYAAEAEKNYHLSNATLTTAVRYEHQADLQRGMMKNCLFKQQPNTTIIKLKLATL